MAANPNPWRPVATPPERNKMVIVWGGSGPMRFATLDANGQWRGVMGRPLHSPPTLWQPRPLTPAEMAARVNGKAPDG